MEDDTKLLKSLQVGAREGQGRGLRVCQVRKLQPQEEMTTLLDGCATRCLRQVRGEDEGQRSQPVKVATGAVQLKQRKETGTLLTMGPVQAIVPVSKMLQMGYNMARTKDECVGHHGPRVAGGEQGVC